MTGVIDRSASVLHLLGAIAQKWLDDAEVTEICVNRPGEVWCQRAGHWECHGMPDANQQHLSSFATAVAKFVSNDVSDVRPILSAILPKGERIQIVQPPACEHGTLSVTIRKPSESVYTLDDYQEQGFFKAAPPAPTELTDIERQLIKLKQSGDIRQFLTSAVLTGQNIVISGETNSGKTTLMKALMQAIPACQRIITLEDVAELFLPLHPNHVHLFYQVATAEASSAEVSATDLLKCCLRMNPDRIMLAELRGGETYDFLNVAASGHGGSITSVHAGSCELTFERMALMVLQSPQGQALPYDVIRRLLHLVVDVVVHVHNDVDGVGRHITDIWYEPAIKRSAAAGAKA